MINIRLQEIIYNNLVKLKITKSNKSLKNQEINNDKIFSPRTLKKTISNENFIKYQWGWTI
tara:strand:+ start:187 stop:369 length:183 start_codon:yes stop_codon:yes gene_type:complete